MEDRIDLNCDLGESFGRYVIGNDTEIMPLITSANIACGYHAGDPVVMARTVDLAKKHDVAIGAHPGYPDLMGFGRRDMKLSKEEVRSLVIYQTGALEGFAKTIGMNIQHVKPHGALYNAAAEASNYADAIIEAVDAIGKNLILFAPAGSQVAKRAEETGLRVAQEVFADRAYRVDGSLAPRNATGAVLTNVEAVAQRAVRMVKSGELIAIDGRVVSFTEIHTICVHGDTANSVEITKSIRQALAESKVDVAPVGTFIR